jgi:hypothetical protein
MVGLPADAGAFFMFQLLVFLTTNAAISLGYAIGTVAPSVAVALALGYAHLLRAIVQRNCMDVMYAVRCAALFASHTRLESSDASHPLRGLLVHTRRPMILIPLTIFEGLLVNVGDIPK